MMKHCLYRTENTKKKYNANQNKKSRGISFSTRLVLGVVSPTGIGACLLPFCALPKKTFHWAYHIADILQKQKENQNKQVTMR